MAVTTNTSPPTCPRVNSPDEIIQALLTQPAGSRVRAPRHLIGICSRTHDIIVTPLFYSADSGIPFGISYRVGWEDPGMLDHLQALTEEGGVQ